MDDQTGHEYDAMLALEDLESLHEDLEELGLTGLEQGDKVPDELRQRMKQLEVHDIQQIHDKIMCLHAQLDQDESELTITDS